MRRVRVSSAQANAFAEKAARSVALLWHEESTGRFSDDELSQLTDSIWEIVATQGHASAEAEPALRWHR
jgi:hypothetical protein